MPDDEIRVYNHRPAIQTFEKHGVPLFFLVPVGGKGSQIYSQHCRDSLRLNAVSDMRLHPGRSRQLETISVDLLSETGHPLVETARRRECSPDRTIPIANTIRHFVVTGIHDLTDISAASLIFSSSKTASLVTFRTGRIQGKRCWHCTVVLKVLESGQLKNEKPWRRANVGG